MAINENRNAVDASVETAVFALSSGADDLARSSLEDRIAIVEALLANVIRYSGEWVELCCRAKSIERPAARSEEVLAGPTTTARYLRLLIQSLREIAAAGRPTLPGKVRRLGDGRLAVPVFPARGVFDSTVFMGLRAEVWMQPHVQPETLHGQLLAPVTETRDTAPISVVLGAGNVSAIPATDALSILFQQRSVVLLKLNPVNEYLEEVFSKIFTPAIDRGWMRILKGGAELGASACNHNAVRHVHITGSHHTHDNIVWGPAAERADRKQGNRPVLDKPITSELGNVSPWIIVPGTYTEKELRFQAINIAASLVNNAGFNCLTTRVIVTGTEWSQRDQFLAFLREALQQIPERVPYYPGARKRYARFAGHAPPVNSNTLPWTLIEGLSPNEDTPLFTDESFVCVCAEVRLPGSLNEFLGAAIDFCNHKLFGSLCAAITMTDAFQRQSEALVQQGITDLNYGSVCINQWPGLVYGLMTPPWGAFPGSSLQDVQSGIGHVHNLYFLDNFEKTVFYGPLCNFPKPIWFPSHTRSEEIAWQLLHFYGNPSVWKLPGLLVPALLG